MKALLIIAPKNFRDEEYFHTKEELESRDIKIVTASKQMGEITGMLGGKVEPDITLDMVNVGEYNAIVFIGGSGTVEYFDDSDAFRIAKEAVRTGKVLAAICLAPSILARAGLLKGKNATVYESEADTLKKMGAKYFNKPVVIDGKIITANGPVAARQFGVEIAKLLGV